MKKKHDTKHTSFSVKKPFFAYRNGSTAVHRAHPIAKLIVLASFCSVCFAPVSSNATAVWVLFACALFACAVFFFARGNTDTIRVCLYALLLGVFVTVFRFLGVSCTRFAPFTEPLVQKLGSARSVLSGEPYVRFLCFVFSFDFAGLVAGALYTARLFLTALFCELFFETTSLVSLRYALEDAERAAAKRFPFVKRVPFALVVFLSIRFIPHIASLWQSVRRASHARSGALWGGGTDVGRMRFWRTVRLFVYARALELSALFSCLLHDAEETRKAVLSRSG